MIKRYTSLLKNWAYYSLPTAFVFLFFTNLQAQTAPAKQWDRSFGGLQNSFFYSLQQTSDGGYILGGSSDVGIDGHKSQPSQGMNDYWIVKINAAGIKVWDKTYGGNDVEWLETIKQTSDGGYILGGRSGSGASGDKSQPSRGFRDFWVVKVDANGNKLWDKTIGGSMYDDLYSLQQTTDGGYILAGYSGSGISGDKTQPNKGGHDYWVVKLDGNGNIQWDKTFGGSGDDLLFDVIQTTDGGYMLGGFSPSGISADKSQASKGSFDYWIIKVDAYGNKQWDKTFGGSFSDDLQVVQQTTDGGYILGGRSISDISGDKSQPLHGSISAGLSDYWVVKVDATGNKLWDKSFGGDNYEELQSIQQTSDGGYILGGQTRSSMNGDVSEVNRGSFGSPDYWIVKLDANGNKIWEKIFGGSAFDELQSLQQTSDGGYILGGSSQSGISGDKSQPTHCCSEYWIIKLAPEGSPKPVDMGVTSILGLDSTCNFTNKESISITVKNMGTTPQRNIAVSYKINNSVPVNEVVAGPIAPSASVSYTFNTKADLSKLGTYTIEARTNFPGDSRTGNDTFKKITASSIPVAPTITVVGDACNDSVPLIATGAPVGGDYIWYNVATAGTPLYSNPSGIFNAPNLSITTFYVAAKDAIGCEGPRTPITLKPCHSTFSPDESALIPNIVTPNSDGRNETFHPQNLPEGKWQLQIYNRWGIQLFEAADYQNNWPDKKIADGTYYYLLKNSETGQQYKGWVEVVQ